MDYLKQIAEKRKKWASLVPLSKVDQLLKEAPQRENPSEYLSYISDTFGIGPADSRKKGAKEAKINDFFAKRVAESEGATGEAPKEPGKGPTGPIKAGASNSSGVLGFLKEAFEGFTGTGEGGKK